MNLHEVLLTDLELGIFIAAVEAWAEDLADDKDREVARRLVDRLSMPFKLPRGRTS